MRSGKLSVTLDSSNIIKHAMMFEVEDFPEVMHEFAGIGGIVQTLLYAQQFGGVDIYVRKWREGKPPSREVMNMLQFYQPRHVEAICVMFGGARIHLKRCSAMFKQMRDAEIQSLNAAGLSKIDVARHTGSSIRHVRQVCNG